MKSKYRLVSGFIFGVMALAQATRAFLQWPAQVDGVSIPVWISWVAMIVAGSLCAWAFSNKH